MGSHKIDELQYAPAFLSFCKYWPDDGLLRRKLVTNNRNSKIKRQLCQTEYIFKFHFNIIHFSWRRETFYSASLGWSLEG